MKGFLIHSPLEYYAEKTPDHAAISLNGESISYAELNNRSNQFANALIDIGVKPQDRVGLFIHKSFELVIAMYGTLKAGGIFVPLDPFMPADRLSFIIKDCEINVLASSELLLTTINNINTNSSLSIIGTNNKAKFNSLEWDKINTYPTEKPPVVFIDQFLGYIMYTSGSTGVPKGMMHTHSGSICYANWGAAHVSMTANDRVASHAPLHFDLSIFDFFSTLRTGATVVLVPEAVTKFPASWTKLIEDERVSVVFTVPYTLITMVEQGAIQERNLTSLRWILFGGEPYPRVKLREIMALLPNAQFTNVYGPAEAPSCTCYDIPRPLPESDEPLPIGTVSLNSEDLIINSNNEDCAINEPGELCIRSSTLTRGYWNQSELNEKAFLYRKGFGPFPTVYYRTGDRVVRHEDGLLRFLGRIDRMIKTRGHRVELDEVEAVIGSFSGVMEAAAFVVPDQHDSQSIFAAATLTEGASVTKANLLNHMRAKLPPYAVPLDIDIVENLPHTSTGKVDRNKLVDNWLNKSE